MVQAKVCEYVTKLLLLGDEWRGLIGVFVFVVVE